MFDEHHHLVTLNYQYTYCASDPTQVEIKGYWCDCTQPQSHVNLGQLGTQLLYIQPTVPVKSYDDGYEDGWTDGRNELVEDQFEGWRAD